VLHTIQFQGKVPGRKALTKGVQRIECHDFQAYFKEISPDEISGKQEIDKWEL
jgi:hypothetical protein